MKKHRLWILVVATGFHFGLSVFLAKIAAQHGIGALHFTFWPTIAAALILALHAYRSHGAALPWKTLTIFGLIVGTLGHALPNLLAFWLSAHAGAGFAAMAYTLVPAATLGIALLVNQEPWKWKRAIAVLIGVAGGVLLVLAKMDGGLPAIGLLALLGIPALVGAGNVYRKNHMPHGVANAWLGAAMLIGSSAVLVPVYFILAPAEMPANATGLTTLAAQTLAMVVAYILYFRLQRIAEPVTFSFMGYVITITGMSLGALFLNETLPWQFIPGLALVVLGFWLIQTSQRSRAAVLR